MTRALSFFDKTIVGIDQAVRTVFGHPQGTGRPNPAEGLEDAILNDEQKRDIAGLMRVNHTGEVCAQALYQGQALTARNKRLAESFQQAAQEENDHLQWCEARLTQLGSRKSYLNPLWYAGSFALGVTAGLVGDKHNLGFLAETERQVMSHLEGHLNKLPEADVRTRAILEQMKQDEAEHAHQAEEAGALDFPPAIKKLMRGMSNVMTSLTYYI